MVIVRHSLSRLWVAVAAIAGSVLAMAGASIPDSRSAALQVLTRVGSIAAAADMSASSNRRDEAPDHRSVPVAGHFCFEPNTAHCTGRSRAQAAPSLEAGYALSSLATRMLQHPLASCISPGCASLGCRTVPSSVVATGLVPTS